MKVLALALSLVLCGSAYSQEKVAAPKKEMPKAAACAGGQCAAPQMAYGYQSTRIVHRERRGRLFHRERHLFRGRRGGCCG